MSIIAELEDSPRGVYCGAVGYLAPTDRGPAARFNVPIRTVIHDAETGVAEYGVGGGITWDSRAQGEFDEIVAKARVLVTRRPRFDLLESVGAEPDGELRRLDEHLARLSASAEYFGFAFDDDAVRGALQAEADRFTGRPAKIRLLLDRRGHIQTGGAPITVPAGPVRLSIDAARALDPGDVLLFHKTSLRAPYDEARARHPDADDVVLVNTRGEITETTTSNLAVRLDGRWWTPPLDSGLLPGCERTALLADGVMEERRLTIDDLRSATEIAALNSVRGWRAAVMVD
jgi:para-aminobenzoate synthetase/4-amino-4-deoxychorismate lyase